MDQIDIIKSENSLLKEENENLKRINANLIRQIKERANASKGQYPKKQHTGYSLVSSVQKEYRYYHNGKHKSVWIFETVLQTPYEISFSYQDVIDSVYDDLFETDDSNNSILDKLGFSGYYSDKTYSEFMEGNNIKDAYQELIDMYKSEYNTSYISKEDLEKMRGYSEKSVKTSCYNLNVRANGRDGYWEMTINHIEPLASIPQELRFPTKRKIKTHVKNNKETDN